METILSVLFWVTVILYAVSFALFAVALIFRKSNLMNYPAASSGVSNTFNLFIHPKGRGIKPLSASGGLNLAIRVTLIGFILHTAVATARWVDTGYPPFVSYFEAMSASAWFGVLIFLLLQQWKAYVRPVGVGIMPFIFLLMGWGGTHPFGEKILPVSLQSFWLFIHASFATAAVGCFMFAAGVAILRLYKQKHNGNLDAQLLTAKAERYDEFNFRLILLGFIFYGIMIVSGAIWANAAWGRFWGWDPIELWSLITWLLYAVYLHIYFTWKKLRGNFLAIYAIIALLVAAFSLWGVGIVYKTLHTYGG